MAGSQVRFATTEAGVPVAFLQRGEGAPIVVVENLGLSSTILAIGGVGFIARLSSRRSVVHFDFPGVGLSEGGPFDMSMVAQVEYMRAIARELGRPVDVYGWGPSAAPAAAFAALAPEWTNRLVLANPCIELRVMEENSPLVQVLELAATDFPLFVTALLSLLGVPLSHQGKLRESLVEATPVGVIRHWLQSVKQFDASHLLERIQAPTLVLQARNNPIVNAQHVRAIATRIPNARIAMVESTPLGGMLFETVDQVIDFYNGDEEPAVNRPPLFARKGLKVIAFTDLESHSEMMQRLGDPAGRTVLREHERLTTETLRQYGGTVVKSQGDGFMASFDSAQAALEWAGALQRAFASRPGEPLRVRIGLNAGEPVDEDNDFFGTSVIAAARVAAEAKGGEVLVANVVRELAVGKGFLFSDRGVAALRGIEEPVHLFELNWARVIDALPGS